MVRVWSKLRFYTLQWANNKDCRMYRLVCAFVVRMHQTARFSHNVTQMWTLYIRRLTSLKGLFLCLRQKRTSIKSQVVKVHIEVCFLYSSPWVGVCVHERSRENNCINGYRYIWGERKSRVIGLNHGAVREIQDGRQHGGQFYWKWVYT